MWTAGGKIAFTVSLKILGKKPVKFMLHMMPGRSIFLNIQHLVSSGSRKKISCK